MESIRLYVLPAILVIVGVFQAFTEARSYRAATSRDRHSRVRLWRRLLTSALLVGVGVMLHLGRTLSPSGAAPTEVVGQFYYWVTVLALVALVGGLAVWDALDSVHRLAHQIERQERDDFERLRAHLADEARGRPKP